ncbi:hypothetical protein H6G74_04760 [Nostoc spongiaeforme FACHB-130]|uniref:Uncharacterized protein n=1 Tax=Nostoc spongiaeforme FACHB-130 TaxID=1357510 RepID=A0ABR8FQB7_9NOSO|nr:hypothetical protein [Nostoc spongiaeforme]MBD2593640.1 hypothetical protein [Nostoc spongiaeforme FACHB-130]
MAHFNALVIIPPDTSDIEAKVKELMYPYYSNLEVEPYKEYLSPEELQQEINYLKTLSQQEIEKLAADWEVNSDDLENLAKMNLEWFEGMIDGIDEKGEYKIYTHNPQGKWDWYTSIEQENVESAKPIFYPCQVNEIPSVVPYAIITPDAQWHELGIEAGLEAWVKNLKSETALSENQINWEQKVQAIKVRYSNYLAVALHCHD